MWVSKKRWDDLEKRVADLEVQVQSQLTIKPEKISESIKEVISSPLPVNQDSRLYQK